MFPLSRLTKFLLLFGVITLFTLPSFADNIVLDFEGLKNNEQVKDFYNGGTGSEGSSSGKNYGISFSAPTLAIIDADAGGSGNFANEPSPNTIIYFLNDDKVIMNVKDGFSGGFSFWYTSTDYGGSVEVWTGENGTGKRIASMELEPLGSDPDGGDPNGYYNRWKKVRVSFDGTAKSVVFKGVANKIGFDNIALGPDSPTNAENENLGIDLGRVMPASYLDPYKEPGWVQHGNFTTADRFEILIKGMPQNSTQEDKWYKKKGICNDLSWKIVDSNGKVVAKEINGTCNVIPYQGDYIIQVGFQLYNTNYFEDGDLQACNSKGCISLNLPRFSVYGTRFDVKQDAFSFENGDWYGSTTFSSNGKVIKKNEEAKIGDVITEFLNPEEEENFWNDVGYVNYYPKGGGKNCKYENGVVACYSYCKKSKNGGIECYPWGHGFCYGMAVASAAFFNNRDENEAWGVHETFDQDTWRKDIIGHWNEETKEANLPYKPFDKSVYNAKKFQAIEKIFYYHVAQQGYKGEGKLWIGSQEEKEVPLGIASFEVVTHLRDLLRDGKVGGLILRFRKDNGETSGHAVTVVQLIEDGEGRTKFILYDNNFPDSLVSFPFSWDVTPEYTGFSNNYLIYYPGDLLGKNWSYTTINLTTGKVYYLFDNQGRWHYRKYYTPWGKLYEVGYISKDPLHAIPVMLARSSNQRSEDHQDVGKFSYDFPKHIKVYLVGGSYIDVKTKDGRDVTLSPLIQEGTAYKNETSPFSSILLLPVDEKYKITVKKSPDFPFLKVFVTIPYDNGTVEYITYDHAEISENGTTYATFTVGRNNDNKNMYREDANRKAASSFAPTTDNTYVTALPSPSQLRGIVLQDGIKLSWKNPQHPNFKEVVIVRTEGEPAASVDNGTEVYRGTDETFTDTPPDMNKAYYYSVFAVGKDGEITEPDTVYVDAYRYTLYGYVTDENNKPVSGVSVTLYNKDKTKLINTTTTDSNGLFTFNGLLDGNYVVTFENPFYTFDDNETNVTLQNGSKEVDVKATGKPAIFMDVPQEVETGNKQRIIWDGVHVKSGDTVSIKLLIDNNTYTIADKLPFNKRYYDWNVSIPAKATRADNNNATATVATLRVELDSDSSAYAEKEIVITRSSENTSSNGNSNPPHSENSVGCSIVPQGSFSNGILNFFLMASGLIGLVGYRRKKH